MLQWVSGVEVGSWGVAVGTSGVEDGSLWCWCHWTYWCGVSGVFVGVGRSWFVGVSIVLEWGVGVWSSGVFVGVSEGPPGVGDGS